MSSHILGEVQDLCEDLLVMHSGRIALAGPLEGLLAGHRILVGPGTGPGDLGFLPDGSAIEVHRADRQTTVLVDRPVPLLPAGWSQSDPTLDELVVAYLRAAPGTAGGGRVVAGTSGPDGGRGLGSVDR